MNLNQESRKWLYQEAATGNKTASDTIRDVNEMELYISCQDRSIRSERELRKGYVILLTGTLIVIGFIGLTILTIISIL